MASDMEQAWLEEYLQCFNATEAARRAGYAHPNKLGPLKKKKFQEEITARLDEMAMTTEEALHHLTTIARADLGQYVTDRGLDIEAIKRDGLTAVIKSAKRVVTQFDNRLEVETHDKLAAIDKILRARGAYKDNLDITSGGKLIKGYAIVNPDDWDEDKAD